MASVDNEAMEDGSEPPPNSTTHGIGTGDDDDVGGKRRKLNPQAEDPAEEGSGGGKSGEPSNAAAAAATGASGGTSFPSSRMTRDEAPLRSAALSNGAAGSGAGVGDAAGNVGLHRTPSAMSGVSFAGGPPSEVGGAGSGAGTGAGGAGSLAPAPFRAAPSESGSAAETTATDSMLPLSMQLMRPFWIMGCATCAGRDCGVPGGAHPPMAGHASIDEEDVDADSGRAVVLAGNGAAAPAAPDHPAALRRRHGSSHSLQSAHSAQSLPLAVAPARPASSTERLMQQYVAACHLYGCQDRINAGVLTTLRFSLPALRTSASFHDADMLALCEVLLEHGNGAAAFVRRLDFSISSREGKLHGKRGFRSHGAYALGRVLSSNRHIEEVFLQRNRVGPYGSSAIFLAAADNPVLRTLVMRRCRVGERGALAFAEHLGKGGCGLKEVDVSVNQIGFRGCLEVEEALVRARRKGKRIEVDLEGNLVLQEVMNSITHGLGIFLCIIGTFLLLNRVKDKPSRYVASCSVYSTSLLVLYTSSTLYHSFFALTMTRYIFGVLDKCAIYLLIAGSYTPYLRIALANQPKWDVWLLFFIWACCLSGIAVEALFPQWKHRGKFSLAMYLGMGWCCMVCVPDLLAVLPQGAINLLVLGGVGYTSGVPFFVRNNNLDHSIWHLFVLVGSMFHWFGVFSFVVLL